MKELIQKYFQVGTIHWMSFPPINYHPLESLKIIAQDNYFNAIEITQSESDEARAGTKRVIDRAWAMVE